MATAPLVSDLVPRMWRAARARGVDAPDWGDTTPPGDCALDPDRYRALLAERATGVRLDIQGDAVRVTAPPGSVIRLWNGEATTLHTGDGQETTLLLPPDVLSDPPPVPKAWGRPQAGRTGAVVFTRGDRVGTGWLGVYDDPRLNGPSRRSQRRSRRGATAPIAG